MPTPLLHTFHYVSYDIALHLPLAVSGRHLTEIERYTIAVVHPSNRLRVHLPAGSPA